MAFELLFTEYCITTIGRPWGRRLAKFASINSYHYNNRSRVFPIKWFIAGKRHSSRNWIKEPASNLSSGFFNNQLATSLSLEMAQIAE